MNCETCDDRGWVVVVTAFGDVSLSDCPECAARRLKAYRDSRWPYWLRAGGQSQLSPVLKSADGGDQIV